MSKQARTLFLGMLLVTGIFCATTVFATTLNPTEVHLINPIGGTKENPTGDVNIQIILGRILTQALGVMGSIAFLMFVIGGVFWLTSAGNSEKVEKGTETMTWAAIGILIIFSSYAILRLVLSSLGATGLDGGGATDTSNAGANNTQSSCVPGDTESIKKVCTTFSGTDCEKNAYCVFRKAAEYCDAKSENDLAAFCETKTGAACTGACTKSGSFCKPNVSGAKGICAALSESPTNCTAALVCKITKFEDKCEPADTEKIAAYCAAQEGAKCSGVCTTKS